MKLKTNILHVSAKQGLIKFCMRCSGAQSPHTSPKDLGALGQSRVWFHAKKGIRCLVKFNHNFRSWGGWAFTNFRERLFTLEKTIEENIEPAYFKEKMCRLQLQLNLSSSALTVIVNCEASNNKLFLVRTNYFLNKIRARVS
jgi:hypothetical protein